MKIVEDPQYSGSVVNDGVGVCFLSGSIRRRDISLTTETVALINQNLSAPSNEGLDRYWKISGDLNVSLRTRPGERSRYKIAKNSLPWWDYIGDPKTSEFSILAGYEWRDPLTRVNYEAWKAVVMASISTAD
jgi:hypothetical protein